MLRWFERARRRGKASALLISASAALVVGAPSAAASFGAPATPAAEGQAVADIAVDKADSSDPVRVGGNFHYNIRVRNLGPDEATGVQLTDTLPESFELVSSTGAKSCTRDEDVHCELNDIAPEGSVTVVLHVRASTPGTFTDTATASSLAADTNRENNSDSESTEILGTSGTEPSSHLIVVDHVVNDNGGKSAAGDFALAVKGDSPSPAQFSGAENPGTDVTLVPGGYEVSQETAPGYVTTLSSDCVGTISPGETKTCTVLNNDVAPITLAIAADPPTVPAGAITRYTVTFGNANTQNVAVSNVSVTLPLGFAYQVGSTSGALTGDPQVSGGPGAPETLTWAGPVEVAANATGSLTFSATASPTPGTYSAVVKGTVDAPYTVDANAQAVPVTVITADSGQAPSGGTSQPSGGSGQPSDGSGQPSGGSGQTTKTTTSGGTDPVAPPDFQKSADAEPVSGEVLVREPGATDFVPLTTATQLPFGSEIDATNGRVELATVDATGTLYHADFYEGRFLLRNQYANGITVLQLSGSDFTSCKKSAKRSLAALDKQKPKKSAHSKNKNKKKKKPKKKAKQSKKVVRHLWGSGTGKFRTRGRYVAATVQGTQWLTEDRCDGTRAYVQEGVVTVRDLVKHKTIRLGAGQSYVGRPRR
jgi:uncharacterized repeat protein (TIGR01451 family)